MAESGEVRDSDGETEQHSEELRIYDETESYLANGSYPVSATKMEKGVIRKRAKKFHLVDAWCPPLQGDAEGRPAETKTGINIVAINCMMQHRLDRFSKPLIVQA